MAAKIMKRAGVIGAGVMGARRKSYAAGIALAVLVSIAAAAVIHLSITYRIGEPLSVFDQLRDYRIYEPFTLFTRESQQRYKEQFEGVTRVVMASIEGMLDEKYRRGCTAS